uniref:Ion transport domain-containing protein n=1 Tax=Electrophorus electricus TaxID=8005 RepID=A0A4W4FUR0_ELEEL
NYVAKVTQNPFFDGFIIVSNILDTVFMALETDYNLKYKNFNFFMVMYIMQFLMKVYVEPRTYWKNGYNMLDAAILVASVIMLATNGGGFGSHSYAGTIRAFRSLRLLKAVSIIPEIQGAVHVLGLMLLLLFNFGVIGCFYFGNPDPEHWGDLPSSMFTLFMLFTLDGWTHLQKAFDDLGLNGSLGFTIVFIVIACFIIFNVFIGVTITEDLFFKHDLFLTLYFLYHVQMGNEQHFTRLAEHLKNSVLHTDSMVVNDGCTGLSFIDTYLSILEHQKITMNKYAGYYKLVIDHVHWLL